MILRIRTYIGVSGLDQTDDFQKFCGSGLDLDWKISQSAHFWRKVQTDAAVEILKWENGQGQMLFRRLLEQPMHAHLAN